MRELTGHLKGEEREGTGSRSRAGCWWGRAGKWGQDTLQPGQAQGLLRHSAPAFGNDRNPQQ